MESESEKLRAAQASFELAKKFALLPPIRQTKERLALHPETTEEILSAGEPLLADESWLGDYLTEVLQACADDSWLCPSINESAGIRESFFSSLQIIDDITMSASINAGSHLDFARHQAVQGGAGIVRMSGRPTLSRLVSKHPIRLKRWECSHPLDQLDLGQSTELRIVGEEEIQPGERFSVDGRIQSLSFAHIDAPVVLVQIADNRNASSLTVDFDSATGQVVAASLASRSSARAQVMLGALRLMGRSDRYPLLEKYVEQPDAYLRWQVMREMVAMNGTREIDALHRFSQRETNPMILDAAKRTLEFLSNEQTNAN